MIADFRTRNNGHLILRGLRDRFKKAKFGGQLVFLLGAMWDATNLPLRVAR